MEILIAVAAKIVEYTVEPVGQWLCYSFHYSSNIRRMKNRVEELQLARDRVQNSIASARRNGEEIQAHVTTWLTKVNRTTEEVGKVLQVEERAQTRCFNRAWLLHQLSREAKNIVEVIGEVLEEYGRFESVSYRPSLQEIVTPRSMDYVDSDSRMSTMKALMEALRDDNIHLIGVWGMPGVGKSTLVREVAKQAKVEKLFHEVAMANVTHCPDLRRIQGEIADRLDLKFDEETVLGRASRLRARLTKPNDKKILVILDDIWPNLELEEIGIPYEGCKLLLTSRNREVLVCGMGTQKDFGLDVLHEEEAWSLFEKMVGDCSKDPSLRSTATEVAKECAGLPLALVTVSKALKNKELFEWKNALQLLRKPAPGHLTRMQSRIYCSIELSYKLLASEEVREVLLLCAQMGYYIFERDLLKYCYGLGLFHGVNTLEDARNRLYTILRILKDWCLLLPSPYSFELLCMHDVVRDAATLIASRDHNMFVVRVDGGLKEWPNADALKRCGVFSIRDGVIRELPNEMECPELRFLCVYGGDCPLQISNTFFAGMGNLKVLDLTKMQLPSLPSSLPLLTNLQTLCLDQCVLGDIAIIGELKNLVVLSLLKSNLSQLPEEIGLLTRLRLLDLSDCSQLEVIPPNVLSSLVALEELYMRNSFVKWEVEGLNEERNNASLVELKHLSHLITLEIHIQDASNLPKDLSFEKLERYVILVGDVWDWPNRQGGASRTLKLKRNTSFKLDAGIKMLLKRVENLYLDELKGVESVVNELDREGFHQLKHLHIQNNAEIKCIIKSRMLDIVFPALETILLKNMSSLEEICHDRLQKGFGNLRVVKVKHCDKLKFVFSSSIARGLPQLEELEISECSIMGAIVVKEGKMEDEDTSLFPQLRRLALEHLPKLMSFLSTQNSLVTDAGEIISEGKPNFYMPILYEQVVFPNLETLELSSTGLEDIQHSQHQAIRSSYRLAHIQSTSKFQNLLDLEVKGSATIKYLLSFSIARFMVQLKHLHIMECKVMEEILVTEDLGVVEEIIPKVLFPQLECLILKELPILKRFCEASNIEFPSLKMLRIEHCPRLKTFTFKPVSSSMTVSKELKEMNVEEGLHTTLQPLFNEEVAFPSLEFLSLSKMDDLKFIWRNQFAGDSFCKLRGIVVEFCENLVNIFQFDMTRFQSLETLLVTGCDSLQEVFELQGLNITETDAVTPIQLKELHLIVLPNMRHVWSKDPKPIFNFENLQRVRAMQCLSLKSLFPASVATCPTQLEQLVIVGCLELEEIVAEEEAEQPIARFFFPRVTVLQLALLPRLKWFYPGLHTSEWPMLKDMLVALCSKVEIFASNLLSFQNSQLEIKQPLFLVDDEVPFPSLETLRIICMAELKIIWHNQFTADSFCNPLTMKVEFCENLIDHQETCGVTATQLKELHLLHLPKLKHIWNKDLQEIFSFQNSLEVHALACERTESSFPGAEQDFPETLECEMDNYGVKKIVVRGLNSRAFPQANEFILQIDRC